MCFLLRLHILLLPLFWTRGDGMWAGIVGGHEAIPHSRPYMVYLSLFKNSSTFSSCDGFLLREDFVLTAAHCKALFIMVFVGLHNTSAMDRNNMLLVKQIPHPNYTGDFHDIMLLKLKRNITFSRTIQPIALPKTQNEAFSNNCLLLGWGCQTFCENDPSHVLKELNVTISNSKNCTSPDILCTEGQEGPAEGDSGGPLVCCNVAHGVVSSRLEMGDHHFFRYMRIERYLPWINMVMNERNTE